MNTHLKQITPRFKIGDTVKTNQLYHKTGRQYFGRYLNYISTFAIITNIIVEKTVENPVMYETNHASVSIINEIFLEGAKNEHTN